LPLVMAVAEAAVVAGALSIKVAADVAPAGAAAEAVIADTVVLAATTLL